MKRLDTRPMASRLARAAAVPAMLAAILAAGAPALAQKKSPAPPKNASEAPPIPLRGLNILSPPVKEPPLSFAESDWRTPDPDDLLVIDTNKGRIIVELSTATAPLSVARIKALARQHFYDGQTFFRVIESFMDQTGDPKNTGDGGSTLPDLKGEFTFRRDRNTPFVVVSRPDGGEVGFVGALPVESQPQAIMALTADGKATAWARFCEGVAGIARAAGVDSANSQFFLMRSAYPSLEQRYTGFGRVLVGRVRGAGHQGRLSSGRSRPHDPCAPGQRSAPWRTPQHPCARSRTARVQGLAGPHPCGPGRGLLHLRHPASRPGAVRPS